MSVQGTYEQETEVPLLEAENVTVRFGGVTALDSVDITVPRNTLVGLVGPNGAGKTTLFGVISGLLRPKTGRVRMNGVDITDWSPNRRALNGLSRTFQRLELFSELTVREHVVLAWRVKHGRQRFFFDLTGFGERSQRDEAAYVDGILELLGLSDVSAQPAVSIPLGTGRLVEVARALAGDPSVVLLDEPSSGLDDHETEQLADAIRRVRAARGTSFVLVEHNVDLVLDLSDRITVLDFGCVLMDATPEEVRSSAEVHAAYFGKRVETT
jgi:ABC-type branched-subunit amino acid transport system ATPase component